MSEEKQKTEVLLVNRYKTLIKESVVVEKEIIETADKANSLLQILQKSQEEKTEYNSKLEESYSKLIDENNKVHFLTSLMDGYISKIEEYDRILEVAKVDTKLTDEEKTTVERLVSTIAHPYKVVSGKIEEETEVKEVIDKAVDGKRKETLANFKVGYENSL